jgi:hypothetical protein
MVRLFLTLCTALIRLACNTRHCVSEMVRDFDRREDIVQFGGDGGFDDFDSDVLNEAFKRDMIRGDVS